MSKSLELVNAAQKFIIASANEGGINLRDEFETVEDFKKFVIAMTIKTLVDGGYEVAKAFDLVVGDGAFERLADEVWNNLQN